MAAFRPAPGLDALPEVLVTVDGVAVEAPAVWTVADLLLTLDAGAYRRTIVSGALRAPLCMMGVCFDCLATVEGETDQQACLLRLRPGMAIRRQTDPS